MEFRALKKFFEGIQGTKRRRRTCNPGDISAWCYYRVLHIPFRFQYIQIPVHALCSLYWILGCFFQNYVLCLCVLCLLDQWKCWTRHWEWCINLTFKDDIKVWRTTDFPDVTFWVISLPENASLLCWDLPKAD